MPNTISNRTLLAGKKEATIYMTLTSDGTEETDYVLYDSSAIATSALDSDTLDCTILDCFYSISSATGFFLLEFDADTDIAALSLPANKAGKLCFREFGGLPNNGGTGKTGDITLTTTGLASGDSLMIALRVRRD